MRIPADALVDFKNEPVTGTVEATIVPLDPTAASPAALPGPLEAVTAAGSQVSLESFAMAEVSLWQDGLPVQLAPGARATLELTLPDSLAGKVAASDVIPAWWLDVDAGLWREEGAGAVVPVAGEPGKLVWVVEVGHFTWWNCDEPWTDKNCFDVVVFDEDHDRVPGLPVRSVGDSYAGISTTRFTDGEGRACVEIKRGETAWIDVGSWSPPSHMRVTGSGPASDCAGMGAACTLVTITIPDGFATCTPGASTPCSYRGPAGTEDVGLCQAGANYCNADGTSWSGCTGEVVPTAETCATPFDDDCDGEANEAGGDDCGLFTARAGPGRRESEVSSGMLLDHPLIAERYFFPRPDPPPEPLIVDAGDARLMCRRVVRGANRRMLLCFHGNGEIVADYVHDFEPTVLQLGLDVFLAEYRGYGGSSGAPLLGKMLGDVDAVVQATGVPVERLVVFGRSVGSIFAIEVAHRYPGIAGMILESGIASPLERLRLRVRPAELGVTPGVFEEEIANHLDHERKLGAYQGRLLILHAARDHLVDVSHAERNHAWAGSEDKQLVVFPRGDHNSIQLENHVAYWDAMGRFVQVGGSAGGSSSSTR